MMREMMFLPGVQLLNRLNYTKKFTVLWMMSLLAIAVVSYSLVENLKRTIQPAERRLEGLSYIEPVNRAIQALQLHRGLSAALLNGNHSLSDVRGAQQQAVNDALQQLEEVLPPALGETEDFHHALTEWKQLQKEGLRWPVSANLAAHTQLIEHLQQFEQRVSDEHLLIMDTDVATYYLIDIATNRLADVLERLGRLRAYGAQALSDRKYNEDQRVELKVMLSELEDALRHFKLGIDSVARYNPDIHRVLQAVALDVNGSAGLVAGLVKADILTRRFAYTPQAFLNLATTQIDNSYAQLYDTLLPMAGRLTQLHIERAKREMLVSVGLSLLVFLLVGYLSVSIYYTIVGNIDLLVRSMQAFAKGDLAVRVELDTHDELNQVAYGFNDMAKEFSILLDRHRENEERLRATIETAMDAVVQMDEEGRIIGWNSQAERFFGWPRGEVLGKLVHETIVPPQYRGAHTKGLERFLRSGRGTVINSRVEMAGLHRDGHEFPIELSVAPIQTGEKYEFSAFIRDITQQKASEQTIWNQANFDNLTGLPNRHMFHDRLSQDIRKAHRAGLKVALLFIDLDKFKEVNDTLGHNMGDVLLREAARRIGSCTREADTVARLGGDEFTVIMTGLEDAGSVDRVASKILQRLTEPFRLGEDIAYVSASIGATLYPDDATVLEEMLKNADQAMYAAKDSGRNRFSYFTQSMQRAAQDRMLLITELRGALGDDQFLIHYQPIVSLVDGRIHKAEALIRWQHPDIGLVSPARFIPLAEDTGLIVEIGDWVFREAARQAKHWSTMCEGGCQISVNMSPVQFQSNHGVQQSWLAYLQELELPGHTLNIEITEGLLLDANPAVYAKLHEFSVAGMQVSVDDFGTGYSSLSYLKKFDIDYLKIDQSFVRNLTPEADDLVLCEAIIVMAHKLGLKVIAEGVETDLQRKLLAAAGCDYAQGYLFAKPLPVAEFEELFRRGSIREI